MISLESIQPGQQCYAYSSKRNIYHHFLILEKEKVSHKLKCCAMTPLQ